MALLEVKNLSISFSGASAVKDLSFSIEKGEIFSLIGESGSGKSASALAIMKLLPNSTKYSGEIIFDGMNLANFSERQMREIRGLRIGMIFQEPMTSLNPLHNIGKQIAEMIELHQPHIRGKLAIKQRVADLLNMVELGGIKNRLGAYPHELSGGQRQRVMIAMALACEPDLLIADEPTTALDVTIQAQILELLKKLQQKLNMAVLLITHDISVVKKCSNHVGVLKNGELVEQGDISQIMNEPKHPYTNALVNAEITTRIPKATSEEQIFATSNLSIDVGKSGVFCFKKSKHNILDDISFTIQKGETLGVVGESGSGKSSLAAAITRLMNSDGAIIFDQLHISSLNRKELKPIRKDLQIIFQDPFSSLSPRMSVNDIIAESITTHDNKLSKSEISDKINKILEEVGLAAEMKNRYPHEFSGGQRQRIAIARSLVLKPKFLILDEPTSALDLLVQKQIIELLMKLQVDYEMSYLFISHDLKLIRAISDHILVLQKGKMVEYGGAEEIFNYPKQEYTRNLINAALN